MMRKFIAKAIVCTMVVMGLGALVPSSATAYDACSLPLNSDRHVVYRFKNGSDVLPFGRVTVTATKRYYHSYCERFRVGTRTVTHSYSRADYRYVNGSCTSQQIGAMGSGAYPSSSYKKTLVVPNHTCVVQSFTIKHDGKVYRVKLWRINK